MHDQTDTLQRGWDEMNGMMAELNKTVEVQKHNPNHMNQPREQGRFAEHPVKEGIHIPTGREKIQKALNEGRLIEGGKADKCM